MGISKGLASIFLIGGSILLLLLIGGELLFVYLPRGNAPTAHTMSTTIQPGRKSLTSTPVVTGTSTPQVLFSDTFADNSNNWDVINGSGYSISISNNVLNLVEANRDILREAFPTSTPFDNFSISTTFTITRGDLNDSVGLFMRASVDKPQGYYVDMFGDGSGDGSYDIAKVVPDTANGTKARYAYLVKPVKTALLQPNGQPNVITVVMKGVHIVLLINKVVVQSISDAAYASGSIYVFARNGHTSSGVNVSFDSVVVEPAPNQLPG